MIKYLTVVLPQKALSIDQKKNENREEKILTQKCLNLKQWNMYSPWLNQHVRVGAQVNLVRSQWVRVSAKNFTSTISWLIKANEFIIIKCVFNLIYRQLVQCLHTYINKPFILSNRQLFKEVSIIGIGISEIMEIASEKLLKTASSETFKSSPLNSSLFPRSTSDSCEIREFPHKFCHIARWRWQMTNDGDGNAGGK